MSDFGFRVCGEHVELVATTRQSDIRNPKSFLCVIVSGRIRRLLEWRVNYETTIDTLLTGAWLPAGRNIEPCGGRWRLHRNRFSRRRQYDTLGDQQPRRHRRNLHAGRQEYSWFWAERRPIPQD